LSPDRPHLAVLLPHQPSASRRPTVPDHATSESAKGARKAQRLPRHHAHPPTRGVRLPRGSALRRVSSEHRRTPRAVIRSQSRLTGRSRAHRPGTATTQVAVVLAAEQIAGCAGGPSRRSVNVYVPSLRDEWWNPDRAAAADRIVMSPSAVLGPVDPQIGATIRSRQSSPQWSARIPTRPTTER